MGWLRESEVVSGGLTSEKVWQVWGDKIDGVFWEQLK